MKDNDHEHHEHGDEIDRRGHSSHTMDGGMDSASDFLRRFWIVSVLLVPLLLLTKTGLGVLGFSDFYLRPYLQLGIATAIFYFALIFFEHAKHEIKAKNYGMMTLVSLAVGSGYLFSAVSTFLPSFNAEFYLEISTLIWVLLFGHYLEAKSSAGAGDALNEVAKLLPKKGHLLVENEERDVDISDLKEGDIVLVKPGEKVPADGVIIEGKANFNEFLISGESKPVEKQETNRVIAGSICIDGSVQVKLDKVGENSTIGQIQKLIAQAKQTKPSSQSIADKAAGILTFTALGVAILTVLIWTLFIGQSFTFALTLGITVLVIACPHALGLAIPTVSTIATTLAIKNGLFVKDLKKLEIIKDVDYVVFDKTGTLTEGEFEVAEVVNMGGGKQDVLRLSASLESKSSHMIGLSVVKHAKEKNLLLMKVSNFKNIAGKGVRGVIGGKEYVIGNKLLMREDGLWSDEIKKNYRRYAKQGKTVVFLASSQAILGMIILADQIKPESKEAISSLHNLGIKTAMLTGDGEKVARAVSEELGIDAYFAQVLPENKYKYIKELQSKGNKVMMVGDGVNDAPALTQADVGIAIGAGTDIAVEAGDVVLTRNNLQDIVSLVVLARKVYRKMIENLAWALGYNVIAIPAAAGVFVPLGFSLRPEIGAILMSLSSVIVVVNAMTLKRTSLQPTPQLKSG